MWIKICANTNLADARLAADLGADAVGFVFAPSKRQVTAPQVAAITRELPAHVEKVGVFSATDPEEIAQAVFSSGLTAVQLHGTFDRSLVQSLARTLAGNPASRFSAGSHGPARGEVKIIQTVAYEIDAEYRFPADRRFETALTEVLSEPAIWSVLMDAARRGASGGLGVSFDWDRAAPILARARAAAVGNSGAPPRLIVAGGLRAENLTGAVAALAPWGVDVASGVEAAPGQKDPRRLRAFLSTARS